MVSHSIDRVSQSVNAPQAITRAKRALWICGNAATLRSSDVWDALVECALP